MGPTRAIADAALVAQRGQGYANGALVDILRPYERSVETSDAGVLVRVVGLDDLIRMKRASGRPQDLRDIAYLSPPEGYSDERWRASSRPGRARST